MKLTGLQIFKYLPGGKKEPEANCKKCGFPTCMAFAMKLAKNETEITNCPHATDELKAVFEESSQLQQAEITFGSPENQVKIGNETVMFRHDKKFVNPTCIAVKINCTDTDFERKLEEVKTYSVERVGEDLKVSAIALEDGGDCFEVKADMVLKSGIPSILISQSVDKLRNILEKNKEFKPLVFLKNATSADLTSLENDFGVSVVASAPCISELADMTSEMLENKSEKIVLNLQNQEQSEVIENLTYIRRAAIENKFKPLGFPVIMSIKDIVDVSENVIEQGIWASILLCKYANIIILENLDKEVVYSLLTLRQNIYTDPEKPLQIEPKLYPIGDVDENSPVIVTTNFALTYFTVVGEIEASNIPSYLVITPSDGMSVLTAWSADKFNGEIIAKTVKSYGIENLVSHRELIIPGYASTLKEEIQDELPEWKVIVGANEAVDIVDFLKSYQNGKKAGV